MNNIYHLESCVWEITLECPFHCEYCGSKAGKARDNELNTMECLDLINQLKFLNCKRVSLIGGEIFFRKDWELIVEEIVKANMKVSIVSNGYLFTDSLIKKLKDLNIESIGISLDGKEEIHDRYREKGSFRRALKAINDLTNNNIHTSVITTLHALNVNDLEEMYNILKDTKIFAWQLQACSPMGNAKSNDLNTDFDFMIPINFVKEHLSDAPFSIGIADNIGYCTPEDGYLRGSKTGKGYFRGCSAGLTSIGIDSIGNIRGCESMYDDYFNEGNIREKTLVQIWNDPNSFKYNRKFKLSDLSSGCKNCKYGYICAGGCRSYNYFRTGDLYNSINCAYKNRK